MRRRRRALPPAVVLEAGRTVCDHVTRLAPYRDAAIILAYAANDNEVPTAPLLSLALADHKQVFLPRVEGQGMCFVEYGPGIPMRPGRLGILEPAGEAYKVPEDVLAIVFVPLLAWDGTGARLGRGGGYYDRRFRHSWRRLSRVGLGYAFQQCAVLPHDPWDLRLDYVVTEQGVARCRSEGDAPSVRKEDVGCDDVCTDAGSQPGAGRRCDMGPGLRSTPSD